MKYNRLIIATLILSMFSLSEMKGEEHCFPAPSLSVQTKQKAESLLMTWAEGLLSLKVDDTEDSCLAGNFLCPACAAMHGRTIDIVWPMTWLWSRTGDQRYLDAAVDAVHWGKCNMQKADGSYINDPNHTWRGITVFSQTALGKALVNFSDILPEEVRDDWRALFDIQTEYIFNWMSEPGMEVNINYRAAFPLAMELAYRLSGQERFRLSAAEQVKRVLSCISEEGLLSGESNPMELITKKGFRSIDVGYNIEESLPAMLEYAEMSDDQDLLQKLIPCAEAHLAFILPDGGIDNSFGSRSCKWTYWGSRTSDGILPMLAVLARNGVKGAMHAANLTLDLYSRLTDERGLLTGGLYFKEAGEPTCIHHTFCHMKTIPEWIDSYLPESIVEGQGSLLSETSFGIRQYPTFGIFISSIGNWRATFNNNDYTFSGKREHSTGGGSMTLLYHKKAGLISASSMARYVAVERRNMQEQRNAGQTLCFTPRIQSGQFWSVFDNNAHIRTIDEKTFHVRGKLTDDTGKKKGGSFSIVYSFREDSLKIVLKSRKTAEFILPVISRPEDEILQDDYGFHIIKPTGNLVIETASPITKAETGRADGLAFNPVAGLMSAYFTIKLTPKKQSEVTIRVE